MVRPVVASVETLWLGAVGAAGGAAITRMALEALGKSSPGFLLAAGGACVGGAVATLTPYCVDKLAPKYYTYVAFTIIYLFTAATINRYVPYRPLIAASCLISIIPHWISIRAIRRDLLLASTKNEMLSRVLAMDSHALQVAIQTFKFADSYSAQLFVDAVAQRPDGIRWVRQAFVTQLVEERARDIDHLSDLAIDKLLECDDGEIHLGSVLLRLVQDNPERQFEIFQKVPIKTRRMSDYTLHPDVAKHLLKKPSAADLAICAIKKMVPQGKKFEVDYEELREIFHNWDLSAEECKRIEPHISNRQLLQLVKDGVDDFFPWSPYLCSQAQNRGSSVVDGSGVIEKIADAIAQKRVCRLVWELPYEYIQYSEFLAKCSNFVVCLRGSEEAIMERKPPCSVEEIQTIVKRIQFDRKVTIPWNIMWWMAEEDREILIDILKSFPIMFSAQDMNNPYCWLVMSSAGNIVPESVKTAVRQEPEFFGRFFAECANNNTYRALGGGNHFCFAYGLHHNDARHILKALNQPSKQNLDRALAHRLSETFANPTTGRTLQAILFYDEEVPKYENCDAQAKSLLPHVPPEVFEDVMSYLPTKDCFQLAQTSRLLHNLVSDSLKRKEVRSMGAVRNCLKLVRWVDENLKYHSEWVQYLRGEGSKPEWNREEDYFKRDFPERHAVMVERLTRIREHLTFALRALQERL